MAVSNSPKDDAKVMKDEYIKGAPIDAIALKYNHTAQEVSDLVVTEVSDTPVVAQPVVASTPIPEIKKGK